ncbi:MAG: hypothetical protein LBQ77_00335 [Treponema sp.]|jgi:hypothetical protein|nr:hypothetical protein [Treponema sp.]
MLEYNATLFYKTYFVIKKKSPNQDLLWFIVKRVKEWIEREYHAFTPNGHVTHFRDDNGEMITEVNWTRFSRHESFKVNGKLTGRSEFFIDPLDQKKYWSAEIQELLTEQRETCPRTWRTEIGYKQIDESLAQFSLLVSYFDKSGFIGIAQENPAFEVHPIIPLMIQNQNIICSWGDMILQSDPIELNVGDYPDLKRNIVSIDREIPVIFISPWALEMLDSGFVDNLSKHIMGNAVVFYTRNSALMDEMNYYHDDDVICNNGAIRIYYPFKDGTSRIFISEDKIKLWGSSEIIHVICRAFSQSIRVNEKQYFFRIEDCIRTKRNSEIKRKIAESDQYFIELEIHKDENQAKDSTINSLRNNMKDLLRDLSDREYELDETRREWNTSQTHLATVQPSLEELKDLKKAQEDIFAITKEYPQSALEVAKFFEGLFCNKIAFTKRGWSSLKRCDTKLNILWKALYSMVTRLYDLHKQGSKNIEKEFKNSGEFEVSMHEGRQTHRDTELLRLREDKFGDISINIEKHIKKGNGNGGNSIRVYYDYVPSIKKIVIGHCGRHLDNFSTQKQR